MYVCVCNGRNEDDIERIIESNNLVCMTEVAEYNVCDRCTRCFSHTLKILNNCVDNRYKDQDWYISPKEGCHWEIVV